MAHKKAGGSTSNGRDSNPKMRGVKKFGGESVITGNIIVRQKGTKLHPGNGVGMGKDFTLFALRDGKVQIIERSSNNVVDSVLGGECDFGINFTGIQEPGISFEKLFVEDYVVVFPKGDKLEKKRKVKLSEIKNRSFISIWKGSGSRIYIENALAMQKEDMDWAYEVRHIPTALNMVEQGLGITLAPKLAISKDYSSLSYRPLIDPAVTRTIGLIKRSGRELSYDAKKLYDLLKEKFKR